jgi:hypothetical protein
VRRDRLPAAVRAQIDSGNAFVVTPTEPLQRVPRAGLALTSLGYSTASTPATRIQVPTGGLIIARTDSVGAEVQGALREDLLRRSATVSPEMTFVVDIPIDIVSPIGSSGDADTWRPYVVHPDRLGYEQPAALFAGTVIVALRNTSGSSRPISGSVDLTLLADATIEPTSVIFKDGDIGPRLVRVATNRNGDDVVLRVHATGAPDDDVQVRLPLPTVLRFENPPKRIQAFGLERRRLVIGTAGAPLREPITVRFGEGDAKVEPASRTLEPGGSAEVTLLADEPGVFKITASSDAAISAEATIDARPPLRFLVAMLLGAFVGAFYLHLFRKPKKGTAFRRFALALLGGFIFAAVWIALEVNLTILPLTGVVYSTMAVFAFSAVGGVAGSTLGSLVRSGAAGGSRAGS